MTAAPAVRIFSLHHSVENDITEMLAILKHVGPSDNFALAGTPWKRSGGAVGGGAWARAAADKFKAEPI